MLLSLEHVARRGAQVREAKRVVEKIVKWNRGPCHNWLTSPFDRVYPVAQFQLGNGDTPHARYRPASQVRL